MIDTVNIINFTVNYVFRLKRKSTNKGKSTKEFFTIRFGVIFYTETVKVLRITFGFNNLSTTRTRTCRSRHDKLTTN